MADNINDITDMFGEDPFNVDLLHPDLRAAIVETEVMGPMIKHRFVNSAPYGWKHLNQMYEAKTKAFDKEWAERNIFGCLVLLERPWRWSHLTQWVMAGDLDWMEPKELADLVLDMWMDTEFPGQNQFDAVALFRKVGFVTDYEREYDKPHEPAPSLTVYRGQTKGFPPGASWTTDRKKAEWFARRFNFDGRVPEVLKATVSRKGILAEIYGRGENEVVVDPAYLRGVHPVKMGEIKKSDKGA